MKKLLPLLFLFAIGCIKKHGYTMKMYFLKRDADGKSFVEWRATEFDAPSDSLAYEYALKEYVKEGKKPDILNGTPAKLEVYNNRNKQQVIIRHGFY